MFELKTARVATSLFDRNSQNVLTKLIQTIFIFFPFHPSIPSSPTPAGGWGRVTDMGREQEVEVWVGWGIVD